MNGAGSVESSEAMTVSERVEVLDAVIYSDLFDCAVTEEEIWLFSRAPISRAQLRELLAEEAVGQTLTKRNGLWCLRGREELTSRRPRHRERAEDLRRRAHRVAGALSRVPFVRGLVLTGSAAARDAGSGADLDLLVLVHPGRLATVFTLLGTSSRLLGRGLFCPNHYLATDALSVDRRDIYVAREIAQAQALSGAGGALAEANRWVEEFLPNTPAGPAALTPRQVRSRAQRLAERPLAGRSGDRIERRLRELARSRLEHHHRSRGGPVPEAVLRDLENGTQLRFHGGIDATSLLERYRYSRGELAGRLAEGEV